MRCRFRPAVCTLAVILSCLASGAENANAVSMSYLHEYEFVSEASDFQWDGGFAGFNLDYVIEGSFDLLMTPDPRRPTTFEFVNVDARLIGAQPFQNMSLDDVLHMSSWRGELRDSSTIEFSGLESQGASMTTIGTIGNVMLLLDGRNRAPCCDYFDFQISAAARIMSIRPSVVGNVTRGLELSTGGSRAVPEPCSGWFGSFALIMIAWSCFHSRRSRQ